MAFTLAHWENPRDTIASDLKNNDMAYITHGAKLVFEFLRNINELPSSLINKKILDYGAGTHRFVRLASFLFNESWGYDPVTNCVKTAKEELELTNREKKIINDEKIHLLDDLTLIPTNYFDYIVSINVFEHLNERDSVKALENIIKHLSNNGKAILWLHDKKNMRLINQYNLQKNTNGESINIYKTSKH